MTLFGIQTSGVKSCDKKYRRVVEKIGQEMSRPFPRDPLLHSETHIFTSSTD